MKITDLKELANCRKDTTDFLPAEKLDAISRIFAGRMVPEGKTFRQITDMAFELYAAKEITNYQCTAVVATCCAENSNFRTKSHRYENGKIYEYDSRSGAYIFKQTGSRQRFTQLKHYLD